MVRLFLIVLAWPLAIVIVLTVYGWVRDEFPEPPREAVFSDPVQFPESHRTAQEALARFARLAPVEQDDLRAALEARLLTVDAWLQRLDRAQYRVLCLGEFHTPATRRFLATRFFPHYRTDVLLLETTPEALAGIERRVRDGRAYVPLLDADIGGVLRAARTGNAAVTVRGIEETRTQLRARETRAAPEATRDRTLAHNFWEQFRPGARHVILYGALHCSDQPHWLYRYLREQSPPRDAIRMLDVHVLGEHQHGPLEAFTWFLDQLDLHHPGDFVIPDTRALPPEIHEWFGLLDQHVLTPFAALVVFRQPVARPDRNVTDAR